jgi:hypothetical protein
MSGPVQILGAVAAASAGCLWLWVAGFNWSVVARGRRRPAERPPSLILLAGPVLLVVGLQALRAAAPASVGDLLLPVLIVGLALDPGALPLVVVAAVRRLRAGGRPSDGEGGDGRS